MSGENSPDAFDMFEMLQKIKELSDFFNLNHTANPESQNPSEMPDMEKMFKIMEMVKTLNAYAHSGRSPGQGPHPFDDIKPGQVSAAGLHRPHPAAPESDAFEQFERTLDSPALKSMKAALPYIEFKYRRQLGVFIKLVEIQKLLDVCGDTAVMIGDYTGTDWRRGMLLSMRPHMAEDKKGLIDMLLKLMDMKTILHTVR